MKNTKRILSVKVKKMLDDSPDTSWLGEYSNSTDSEYAIDRAHSEDCASLFPVSREGLRILSRVKAHIETWIESGELGEEAANMILDLEETPECDCSGHLDRNEYRYFNACVENYKGESDADIRKYVCQDYDRMESLSRGDWYFMGIHLDAEVQIGDTIQHITSGGLWGIESDAGEAHFAEIISDETYALKDQLKALGFSARAIATAFKNVEEVSE